jgi:hypothetical protein
MFTVKNFGAFIFSFFSTSHKYAYLYTHIHTKVYQFELRKTGNWKDAEIRELPYLFYISATNSNSVWSYVKFGYFNLTEWKYFFFLSGPNVHK